MDDERLLYWLILLHTGLRRLGPGLDSTSRQALAACSHLPPAPEILEVGCGTGAVSALLTETSGGRVTAVDRVPALIADLRERTNVLERAGRIRPVIADMRALPFAPHTFDLMWSEGAIYVMGFDAGLTAWRPLLRERGYLAVTELTWLTAQPPEAFAEYWRDGYPGIRGIRDNLEAARALGWEVLEHLVLPHEAWTDAYYGPLRARLPDFRAAHAADPEAQAVADMTEEEMALMTKADGICGYVFYVLRRRD
jgi:ubiquinone/menaquinone biosynthesis C-methylase UbiE